MREKIVGRGRERGAAIIVALAFLGALMIMTSAFVSNLVASSRFESSLEAKTKSLYIAEAGLNHAMWKLRESGGEYDGETDVSFGEGSFDILVEEVSAGSKEKTVISRAYLEGYPESRAVSEIRAVVTSQKLESGGSEIIVELWERID